MKKGSIFQHLTSKPSTQEEIKEIARRQGKSFQEVEKDIIYALEDLRYSQKEIEETIKKNSYGTFPDSRISVGNYGKNNEINNAYLCHDHAQFCSRYSPKDIALVTGFGPTNAPTAGTLSIIFRLLEIQEKAPLYCHVIISDLGAFNSRKKPLGLLLENTNRFIRFIKELGFNEKNGELRTHNYFDFFKVSALTSSLITTQDFDENQEVTEKMYKRLNLQGNDFSTMVDKNFTVADILLPIIRDRKKLVLVVAGLEEQYYPRLAKIVIDRMKKTGGGLEEFVHHKPEVSALYGRIIEGLFPYVKMSKSIPESSINIGNSPAEIQRRILDCGERNEHVVLQMMELASDWSPSKIKAAQASFQKRDLAPREWQSMKNEYLEFFLNLKKLWDKTAADAKIKEIRKNIFN